MENAKEIFERECEGYNVIYGIDYSDSVFVFIAYAPGENFNSIDPFYSVNKSDGKVSAFPPHIDLFDKDFVKYKERLY